MYGAGFEFLRAGYAKCMVPGGSPPAGITAGRRDTGRGVTRLDPLGLGLDLRDVSGLLGSNSSTVALDEETAKTLSRAEPIRIGTFGILHPTVLKHFELPFPTSTLELDLEVFL